MSDDKKDFWEDIEDFDELDNFDELEEKAFKMDQVYENIEQPSAGDLPEELYILPLRNSVIMPKIVSPIGIGREKSLALIKMKINQDRLIGIVAQKNSAEENPDFTKLYKYGTLARLHRFVESPDEQKAVIVVGIKRFKIVQAIETEPFLRAKVEYLDDKPAKNTVEWRALVASIKSLAKEILEDLPVIPSQAIEPMEQIDDPEFLINFITTNFDFETSTKVELLRTDSMLKRAKKLKEALNLEYHKIKLQKDINEKVRQKLDKQQREYILQQQLKAIQSELGDDPLKSEIEALKREAKKKNWPAKVQEVFEREIKRLERLMPASPEYGMQMNYLQTLLDLPWGKVTHDNFDLKRAQKILDEDHYGLDKVKERILEYLAVLKLKGDLKSPILCLYGPPGVGKTSLGKSIARALGRKYVRMSLGGLHDEAEIRGHRRTYIGAMPGRIIQNIRKAGADNPVFVLDEVDKIGQDFRGDPASALLEVLDPEQNNAFYDNYLEVEYDLSKVMFIATANTLSTIKPALLDRMEVIEVTGYILEEKIEIATRHLIPKQFKAHGIKRNQLKFTSDAIRTIIEGYTRESGVRELEKKIAAIIRKTAKSIAMGEKRKTTIEAKDIRELLGVPKFTQTTYQEYHGAGVVPGLAWTPVGGEILMIESSLSLGDGKLTLTGNLGKVMKESATIALQYVKAHSLEMKLHPLVFKYWDVHLHVPEGAIPKDGPSAGITMATSLASVFTQHKVKPYLAMTGELTLSGRVLPVGGIKEKILAAKRAGIKEIILSKENKKDIDEIKEIYRKGLTFHYVETMDEVLKLALLDQKVNNPLKIGIPKKKNCK